MLPDRLGHILDVEEDDDILTTAQGSARNGQNYLGEGGNRLGKDQENIFSAGSTAAGEIKGRKLIGRVMKLSNMGYSQHQRLLKLNHKGLSYYKHVPADFNDKAMTSDAF